MTIVLSCLITSVLTYAMVSNRAGEVERAAYYQREAERNQRAICVGRTGALLAECIENQRNAAREAYRAENDLDAQQQMSLWAMWMFVVSAITAGLTLWALWYVRGTLIETRKAVADTGEATNAMIEANKIARVASEWELSAYLGFDGCTCTQINGVNYIEMKLTNFGQTPATVTGWVAQIQMKFTDTTAKSGGERTLISNGGNGGDSIYITPNSTITLQTGNFRLPDEISTEGRGYIDASLIYRFTDIFGKETTVSVELYSRAPFHPSSGFAIIFDVRSQSDAIHDQHMLSNLEFFVNGGREV